MLGLGLAGNSTDEVPREVVTLLAGPHLVRVRVSVGVRVRVMVRVRVGVTVGVRVRAPPAASRSCSRA